MRRIICLMAAILFNFSLMYGDFVQVNENGFGTNINSTIQAMKDFGNYLYAGTENWTTGSEIWRSLDGHHWTNISAASNGFGDANNGRVDTIVTFDGRVYAGTYNWSTGSEIWQSINGDVWNQQNLDGFGDANNQEVVLYSNNGYLYAGTYYGG